MVVALGGIIMVMAMVVTMGAMVVMVATITGGEDEGVGIKK